MSRKAIYLPVDFIDRWIKEADDFDSVSVSQYFSLHIREYIWEIRDTMKKAMKDVPELEI